MEGMLMARPKAKGYDPADRPPIAVTLRGRPEWKEWVERLAKADRSSVAGMIDRAMTFYAKSIGFTEKAPER
jgi:hypothetical protein